MQLRHRHSAARRLCYQVRDNVTAVSVATELMWYGQGLKAAHLATLAMLVTTNALERLQVPRAVRRGVQRPERRELCARPQFPHLRVGRHHGVALRQRGVRRPRRWLHRPARRQLPVERDEARGGGMHF